MTSDFGYEVKAVGQGNDGFVLVYEGPPAVTALAAGCYTGEDEYTVEPSASAWWSSLQEQMAAQEAADNV